MNRAAARAAGFTLLELLVVLAVIALGTGIAMPRLSGWLDRAQARSWQAEVRHYLQQQPFVAFADGRTIHLDRAQLRAHGPALPGGLDYRFERPILYHADGSTSGGVIGIVAEDGHVLERIRVEPLSGGVSEIEVRP